MAPPQSGERISIFEEERKRLKRRLELQQLVHNFSDQMRSQQDVVSITRILVEAVSELTSFRNAFITILDEDGRTLRGVAVSGHKRTFEIGSRLAKYSVQRICVDINDIPAYIQALEKGEIVFHRDKKDIVNILAALTGLNPGILEIIRRTTRMNLALTVPLYVGDPGTGIIPLGFVAISSIKIDVDPEDIRVQRILADQASMALYNVRLFERVRRQAERAEASEANFRRIMDTAHDMIISYDMDGRMRFANNAIRESRLYSLEDELINAETLGRVHPDDAPNLVEAYLGLRDGIPIRGIEYRIRDKSGEWLRHNLNASIVPDSKGGVGEIVVFIRDVTVERQREQQSRRRTKELEVLYALITNLTSPIDYDEMITRSLTVIADLTGADMMTMYSKDTGDPPMIHMMGSLWVPEHLQQWLEEHIPKIPVTELFNLADVNCINDISVLPQEYYDLVHKLGVESVVSIPVRTGGEVTGYVIAGAKGPMDPDEETIAILRAVGDQLGIVLETARLIKERNHA